jgi:glycopeptide antibiotics resistance protein
MLKCNIVKNVILSYKELSKLTLLERAIREINPLSYYTNPPNPNQIPNYLRDDILNVVIFIPLGFYLGYFIKEKKILKFFIFGLLFSLSIEILQIITILGGGSTKDVITNTLGTIIGSIIFKKIYNDKSIKAYNICSIIVLTIITPIVIFIFINTMKNISVYINVLLRRI